MSRRPSPPPELPGFTYVEALGTGGFADVFLYEQAMPRRRVAVKVLLADRISSGAAQEFADEANVMAMLSTHPAIVTIYQAGVAGDGRPYLVMEYCPRPNLQIRARREPFSVAEALRVGIQVAGAVETAHRAGVLHRDIKPANILVTEYNRPALTDFGIASTTGATGEASGMSIPWSPPESFAEPPSSGPRTDVWALGATLFTLLSGRSPFERPGERNSSADLIERIERSALPQLGRADSPASLQSLLERAMAKNPADRFPSAVALARALQKVQIELAHSVTPIDIVDDHPPAEDLKDDDDGLTRVREIVSIEPSVSSYTRPSATTERKGPAQPAPAGPQFIVPPVAAPVEQTQQRAPEPTPAADLDDRTIMRAPQVVAPVASAAPATAPPSTSPVSEAPAVDALQPRRRTAVWLSLAAAGLLVVGGGIVGVNFLAANLAPEPAATPDEVDPQDVLTTVVPKPVEVTGVRDGDEVTFTWINPDPMEGDAYLWSVVDLTGESQAELVPVPTVTFVPESTGTVCIDVLLRRDEGGRSSEPVRGCVE